MTFLISLLSGQALLWARAILNSQSSLVNSFDAFSAHFKKVFGLSIHSRPTHSPQTRHFFGERLHPSVPHTLAASCGWNEMVLITAYRQGLGPQIKIQTAIYDDNVSLESFCKRLKGFPSDSPTVNQMKPLILKPHLLPVLQYQNICRWTPTNSLSRNMRDVSPRVYVFTEEPRDTSSESVLLVPRAQRWVPSISNLRSPYYLWWQ